MKKEVIIVPKDKCPLDIMAEMGEQTRNAWIFLHRNAYQKLNETSNMRSKEAFSQELIWFATDKYPRTAITVEIDKTLWFRVSEIDAEDIAFRNCPQDPQDILFFKMEE